MKTSAFIIVSVIIATVLTGSGCSALHLALMCLQILVFLAGFFGIADWRWILTLGIWIWMVVAETVILPTLCDKRAFIHFAVRAAALVVKVLFSLT